MSGVTQDAKRQLRAGGENLGPSTLLTSATQEELGRAGALLRHAAEGIRKANAAR